MYYYQAFGLTIHSEICFPELLPATELNQPAQIHIKFAHVNSQGINSQGSVTTQFYQATRHTVWLWVPNIARFLITDGNQILIDPMPMIDEDSLRVFLLGSCFGALLMQRNLFLLHGNAVKMGEYCVSFVGHSGVGKSTLSGAFFKEGYSILADDVCAISQKGDVIPSFPQIKLWSDAAKHLNIETTNLRKIRPLIEKYGVPLNKQFYTQILPLKIIYILQPHNLNEFQFISMKGMEKLVPLQTNTYRKNYLKTMQTQQYHFKQCAQIAHQVEVVRIKRPNTDFKLDELVNLVKQDLAQRGLRHEL